MNAEVKVTRNFKKEAKSLLKKYVSLEKDLLKLHDELIVNPKSGTSLGHNAFKIRLAIKSKNKGKSGGARVITYVESEIIGVFEKKKNELIIVNLLSIYDESEVENISDKEVRELIENIEY